MQVNYYSNVRFFLFQPVHSGDNLIQNDPKSAEWVSSEGGIFFGIKEK